MLGSSGRGIYLAEWARYANGDGDRQYFSTDASSGRRQMLLVKALTGKSREFATEIKKDFAPSQDLIDIAQSTPNVQVRNTSALSQEFRPGSLVRAAEGDTTPTTRGKSTLKDLAYICVCVCAFQMMFDSVHAGLHCPGRAGDGDNSSKMYVVYKNESCYPEYLVTYQKVTEIKVSVVDLDEMTKTEHCWCLAEHLLFRTLVDAYANKLATQGRAINRAQLLFTLNDNPLDSNKSLSANGLVDGVRVIATVVINICVIDDITKVEHAMTLKPSASFNRLVDLYAKHRSLNKSQLLFKNNGNSVDLDPGKSLAQNGLSGSSRVVATVVVNIYICMVNAKSKDEVVYFRLNPSTRFDVLVEAYAKRCSLDKAWLLFTIQRAHQSIQLDHSKSLTENGLFENARVLATVGKITIRFRDNGSQNFRHIKACPAAAFDIVAQAYANSRQVDPAQLIFKLNGAELDRGKSVAENGIGKGAEVSEVSVSISGAGLDNNGAKT